MSDLISPVCFFEVGLGVELPPISLTVCTALVSTALPAPNELLLPSAPGAVTFL